VLFWAVVEWRFCRGFCEFWVQERGFWMGTCGDFVVTTWLFAACFSGAKIFLFFEVYFLGGNDNRCGITTKDGQQQIQQYNYDGKCGVLCCAQDDRKDKTHGQTGIG
jgi:hypothetical protein